MKSFLLYICRSKIIHLYFCLITNAFYFPWIQARKKHFKLKQSTKKLLYNPFTEGSCMWWKHYRSEKALQSTALNEKPLNSSALNGWNSHSKCFSVYLYKLFSKLSERNHTDLLSAVLSGTCRTRSLCPRSKTPADYHPSVKLSVYSSDLPVNKYCVIYINDALYDQEWLILVHIYTFMYFSIKRHLIQ